MLFSITPRILLHASYLLVFGYTSYFGNWFTPVVSGTQQTPKSYKICALNIPMGIHNHNFREVRGKLPTLNFKAKVVHNGLGLLVYVSSICIYLNI